MKKKIAVVQTPEDAGVGSLAAMMLREKFGEDVVILTVDQAIAEKVRPEDVCNVPTFTLQTVPTYSAAVYVTDGYMGKAKKGKGGRARNRSKYNNWNK